MITESILAVIATGMMFGAIHAFDVDHIVAMATFSDQQTKKKNILTYAFMWGAGHGGILFFLGLMLILIGFKLPRWFVHYSELMVGVLLIYLGAKLLLLSHRKGILNGYHLHNKSKHQDKRSKRHDHAPFYIGMLHGVAGSAPLLALLPNMLETQFILHISLFSIGCLFGMFCFGYIFGLYQFYVKEIKEKIANVFTQLLGFGSIGLGTFWLFN